MIRYRVSRGVGKREMLSMRFAFDGARPTLRHKRTHMRTNKTVCECALSLSFISASS